MFIQSVQPNRAKHSIIVLDHPRVGVLRKTGYPPFGSLFRQGRDGVWIISEHTDNFRGVA